MESEEESMDVSESDEESDEDSNVSKSDEESCSSSPFDDDSNSVQLFRLKYHQYIPVIKKILEQEKNSAEKSMMRSTISLLLGEDKSMWNSGDLGKTIHKWLEAKLPDPPEVTKVRFHKKNGKFIAAWDVPDWPLPLTYAGECVESSGKRRVVCKFSGVTGTSYELSNFSPIQYYKLTVWAVDDKGQTGARTSSKRDILCKKVGDKIFVDDTSQLRLGYQVYKAYWKGATDVLDPVAFKVIDGDNLREVKALQKVKDRNVVVYRDSGYISEKQSIGRKMYIVMELCRAETFFELLSDSTFSMTSCKLSLLHMMLGINAIHKNGFLHRDVKPQNLLRSKDGSTMKIADFGLCKEMNPDKSKVSKSAHEVGTEGWGSPEHYQTGAQMSEKSDIYSAGLVIAFGLSNGIHVHGRDPRMWKVKIIQGDRPDLSHLACSDKEIARDLIFKMLERDPVQRPTTKDVLLHPFFWKIDDKLLFLHYMSIFFTPFFLRKKTPKQVTKLVMEDLGSQKILIQTATGEANWIKRIEETLGTKKYPHVIKTAKGQAKPFTKYNSSSVFDLIRFIRNVEEHYRENEEFQDSKSSVWKMFYKCFPGLLCAVHHAISRRWRRISKETDFPRNAHRFFIQLAQFKSLPTS